MKIRKFCSQKCHYESRTDPINNFWKYVYKTEHCWFWIGCVAGKRGYGKLTVGKRTVPAHRLSWEIHFGKIPAGQYVCHKCDTRQCVRPDHLFLGTNRENQCDIWDKGGLLNSVKRVRGERSLHSKLTAEQVLNIRSEYKKGNGEQLAKKYGVRGQSINDIVRRKSWTHI